LQAGQKEGVRKGNRDYVRTTGNTQMKQTSKQNEGPFRGARSPLFGVIKWPIIKRQTKKNQAGRRVRQQFKTNIHAKNAKSTGSGVRHLAVTANKLVYHPVVGTQKRGEKEKPQNRTKSDKLPTIRANGQEKKNKMAEDVKRTRTPSGIEGGREVLQQ